MTRKILIGLLLLTPLGMRGEALRIGNLDLSDYRLAWSEEFDGDSLDRSVWNVEDNGSGCGNHELQHYIDSPEVVAVADGKLRLTARRDSCSCGGHEFVSARLNTLGKFNFQYGVVQASIRCPRTADGLWPAFWMMGDDISQSGWPHCGETDVLEMGHADGIAEGVQDRLFNGALHWGRHAGEHFSEVGSMRSLSSLQDGEFHTFTVVWTPESISMYVDDISQPYFTHDIAEDGRVTSASQFFHKPNFLLLNLAVGGDFPDIHTADAVTALADGPRSMEVDYIRIYQKNQ